ncbi:MAG: zinc ribbon domain-containing protein [Ruminococcaceae bacterium]|nr:zinc ribbon domain-containing protein [Oscillospiraceae bacterium]
MAFCGSCGAPLPDENLKFCPKCGASTDGETPTPQNSIPVIEEVKYPMKWFKFLIYFGLFAGAVVNIVQGFLYLTGTIYDMTSGEGMSELVYSVFGGLKAVDIIFGIVLIALGIFGIYTRFRLSGYKSNAPTCVYILYGAVAATGLIYTIVVSSMLGEFIADSVTSIVVSAIMISLNCIYFGKRKSLFDK